MNAWLSLVKNGHIISKFDTEAYKNVECKMPRANKTMPVGLRLAPKALPDQ